MKNDRLNGSCWLSVVGCWRTTKGLPSSFLPTLATALFLFYAPPLLAQWEPDVRLTYKPDTAFTSDNNAWNIAATGDSVHIVWTDGRIGYRRTGIYYKRSTNGGDGWSLDTCLTDSGWSANPSIAIAGPEIHIVWNSNRDGNAEIYYKRSSDGGATWGQDRRISNAAGDSRYPSCGALDSTIHVVWHDWRDGHPEIYYRRSTDSGRSWEPETLLIRDSACATNPSIAATNNLVLAVWYDRRDKNAEIYYKRSTDSGKTWNPDTRLTYDTADSWYPTIGAAGFNVHIFWQDHRDATPAIYYKRSSDSGVSWTPDTCLIGSTVSLSPPSVGVSGENVHLTWADYCNGDWDIYYKHSSNHGLSWGPDNRLTNNRSLSLSPSITTSGSKLHVVWTDWRDGDPEIYYKRNPTGNIGTETAGDRGKRLEVRIKATPNPFTSFVTLPGHEAERFSLYDIAGRRVGTYRGDRIGANLPAGVYFLRYQEMLKQPMNQVQGMVQHDEIVRIVKVR